MSIVGVEARTEAQNEQNNWGQQTMTKEDYGKAYQKGYNLTVRFLVSRGLAYDAAQETAQAAWVKGWERIGQLRDHSMVLTWMNSIALNIHRSYIRREPLLQALPELSTAPKVNLAAIDVRRILKSCKNNDRMVLQRHYLEGFKVQEIAEQQGWTETAVRIRLLRARRTVGKRLGRKFPEPGQSAQSVRRSRSVSEQPDTIAA
jgi:RNA polymerase sigma factor (sigma-70 family)